MCTKRTKTGQLFLKKRKTKMVSNGIGKIKEVNEYDTCYIMERTLWTTTEPVIKGKEGKTTIPKPPTRKTRKCKQEIHTEREEEKGI